MAGGAMLLPKENFHFSLSKSAKSKHLPKTKNSFPEKNPTWKSPFRKEIQIS